MTAFGYDQALGKGLQSANAETGILLGWVLVPGILLILSFLVLHWYPLDGKDWLGIKAAPQCRWETRTGFYRRQP